MSAATPSPHRVLIVRLGSFGDILHAIPAQQELSRQLPGVEIHWLTEPPYARFLEHVEGIDTVWVADTKAWRRTPRSLLDLPRLVRSLRSQHFWQAIDFQGLLKSAILARLSGATTVVGFQGERFKEPAVRHFYHRRLVGDDGSHPHAIEINLALLGALGCEPNGASAAIPLRIPERDHVYVAEKLEECGIESPILINPGAGWVTKLWGAERYARLARRIEAELGLPVLFTHGPGEEFLIDQARAAGQGPIRTFPTDLLQLAALCRRSRLMVAGDTGPLHLAVGLGLPTVAILGPTSPWRNGPFSPHDAVVHRELPCSHSYKRTCANFICMDIPVEEVLRAVCRRLER